MPLYTCNTHTDTYTQRYTDTKHTRSWSQLSSNCVLWVCAGHKANPQIFTCGAVTRHLPVQWALHMDLRCLRNTENSWLAWWTCWSPFPVLILSCYTAWWGLPRWLSGKESTCQCRRHRFNFRVGKIPWKRKWQPTAVFLLGKSHGQRGLAGYNPWGHKELDTT